MSIHAEAGTSAPPTTAPGMWRFFVYSLIGGFVFFLPFEFQGKETIALDHMVSTLMKHFPDLMPYYALALIYAGAVLPLATGRWRRSHATAGWWPRRVLRRRGDEGIMARIELADLAHSHSAKPRGAAAGAGSSIRR